ncbi:uracil-DNA glycosylase family protein [Pulveribacter suum]|uniref:Uracil-DNA glycosylase-like domain-containing protein n=1 Tax=Pulveribacter suum TaxID=2116657 RepID=A0A2P1NI48_9BURK|nr:uracil-DNA glycosylase family protein [Pulveribacter suum]AVP56748.1 hypothetical protein C7H73_03010 [Pulveribacter suum]
MSLDLDNRQRAMLQEMGIALFTAPATRTPPAAPAPALAHAPAAAPAAAPRPAPQPAPEVAAPAPAPPPAPPPAPAPEPEPEPARTPATAASALPPVLLAPPVAPYAQGSAGTGPGSGWLVILECADPADPLAGDAGLLLDNMLRAAGLHRQGGTQLAALVRGAADGGVSAAPLAESLAALRPPMVLLLGLGAARAVLGSPLPLARLRAGAHQLPDGTPALVSYDPAYLLRAPQAKAAAWADLCRALARVRHGLR